MHIPPQDMEIERIYSQILAEGTRALALTSANPGEGVTSLALALAHRNLLAGHSTLLVDLNLHHPAFNVLLRLEEPTNPPELLDQPQLICSKEPNIALTGITAPTKREIVMKLRKPGVLEACINELKKNYDTVIFDTSAINRVNANNIPAERIAAACDGALLVVLSGNTTEAMVSMAVNKLKSAEAQLLGCVMNDRHSPPLKSELLREIRRITPKLGGIANWFEKRIRQNHLLSLEL